MRGVGRYWDRQPFVSMMQGLANFVAQMLGSLVGAGLVLSTTVCEALLDRDRCCFLRTSHYRIISVCSTPLLYRAAVVQACGRHLLVDRLWTRFTGVQW